jgi:hypothetical protein
MEDTWLAVKHVRFTISSTSAIPACNTLKTGSVSDIGAWCGEVNPGKEECGLRTGAS